MNTSQTDNATENTTMKKPKTITPRSHYRSPEGRVEILRYGPYDFELVLDGAPVRSFESPDAAMTEAGAWLTEQAQHIEEYA